MAAEEFEYSVEGFEDTHEGDGNDEVMGYPIPVIRKLPVKEKDEEAREGQPFEEFDFGGKRKKTQPIAECGSRIADLGGNNLGFRISDFEFGIKGLRNKGISDFGRIHCGLRIVDCGIGCWGVGG